MLYHWATETLQYARPLQGSYIMQNECDQIENNWPADKRRRMCSVSIDSAPWALPEPTCHQDVLVN